MEATALQTPQKKIILVVDDEADIREYIADILEPLGHEIKCSPGGNDAWQILQTTPVDLVVSDVMMPEGNGVELLDKIKSWNRENPQVILISGFANISVQEAYEKGAVAFFPKPFNRKVFVHAVEKALEPKVNRWNRASERLEEPVDLKLSVAMPDLLAAASNASVINIGNGGMFLAWGNQLPNVGDKIKFEISFLEEKEKKFKGTGVVRWVRTERDSDNRLPGFGIEFLQLDNNQTVNIIEIINYLKTREFIPRS